MLYYYLYVQNMLKNLKQEEGQGLVEYALIIALVSVAAMAALGVLGTTVTAVFTNINGTLSAGA
jgi:pilus assembly protein Flp/PilA